jgi:iron complex transport system substrate-binding protein
MTRKIVSLIFVFAVLLSGCENNNQLFKSQGSAGNAFTLIDALGREVAFEASPQNIALAGKANLLIANALYLFPEALDRVGVLSSQKQGSANFLETIDPKYAEKVKFTMEVGPEQIAAENPDAVVLKSYLVESLGKPIETLGIPVVYVDLETPEQYYRDLKTLGQLFQDEERAEELIQFYQGHEKKVTDVLNSIPNEVKPSVLLLYYSDKDGEVAFNVPPMGWIQTIITETAGGNPVWNDANLGNGWTKVSLEQIAAWDADKIFIISYFTPVDEVVKGLKDDPQWEALRASQNGELYAFPGDFLSWDQPDSRWILGLTWLASKIHPEAFTELDVFEITQEFYGTMYRMSSDDFINSVEPILYGDLP